MHLMYGITAAHIIITQYSSNLDWIKFKAKKYFSSQVRKINLVCMDGKWPEESQFKELVNIFTLAERIHKIHCSIVH